MRTSQPARRHAANRSLSFARTRSWIPWVALSMAALAGSSSAQNAEFRMLQGHFESVVQARHDHLFDGMDTVSKWEARKQQTRAALERMLWHDRLWPGTPPPVQITGRVERKDYTIENLVLETDRDVYATANLYLPRSGRAPFPVILYQCGHANKSYYSRHGAWFAAHGIAVLVMDNIEMGEIELTHHGVYSHAWFHWYSRGFSPLALELLNARRALDYLCSRADLDAARIGATGRSGGGMTTFFLTALDDRVRASAPVSGTLSTAGWIRQQLSSAHCDCQYPINTHALLYSEIGALMAPRPQLLCNAAADEGFPMDAFNEMTAKMREIYGVYGAGDALRTAVTPGGHSDTETIRLPVYSFFLKEFLGLMAPVEEEGAVDLPTPEELICFPLGLPVHERLSRMDEELLPVSRPVEKAFAREERDQRAAEVKRALRDEVFRYFPKEPAPLEPVWSATNVFQGRLVKKVTFASFRELRVRGLYSLPAVMLKGRLPGLLVVDHRKGIPVWGNAQRLERNEWGNRAVLVIETIDRGSRALEQNLRSYSDDDPLHHMRRQAMVAGTTLESMQVYEILRAFEFLRAQPEADPARITIVGKSDAGVNGLYASFLDGRIERAILGSPPGSHREGPHYLSVLRYTDIPEMIGLMHEKVRIYGEVPLEIRSLLAKLGLDGTTTDSLPHCLPPE